MREKTLTNLTSTVEFKDIYEDVDLQYEVRPEDVKETIVINKNTDNTYFEFNIKAKDLTAKLQADKSIIFYDAKDLSKKVFAMDAPYMIDAKNQQSKDIEVGLTQTKDGYILSLKPNKEWLDSSERVYPIKIDPTAATKDWYNTGNNYGIVLQHENEGSYCGYNNFYSSDNYEEGVRPRIFIQYVNNSGLEGYWTYHSSYTMKIMQTLMDYIFTRKNSDKATIMSAPRKLSSFSS